MTPCAYTYLQVAVTGGHFFKIRDVSRIAQETRRLPLEFLYTSAAYTRIHALLNCTCAPKNRQSENALNLINQRGNVHKLAIKHRNRSALVFVSCLCLILRRLVLIEGCTGCTYMYVARDMVVTTNQC